jgi:hypothetical protein
VYAVPAIAAAREGVATSSPVTFSDGAVAVAYDHCGDADLCAQIRYANGDQLSIYSEGAAYCQPYFVALCTRA